MGDAKSGSKKETMIELTKLMDSLVQVKCLGGREFTGTLRGFDDLVNLVIEDSVEYLRDPTTQLPKEETRKLGMVVVRGTQVSLISPKDGVEEISNPFLQATEDGDGES